MAKLFIAEFKKLTTVGYFPQDIAQAPSTPPVTEQTLAIGAVSLQSNAFNEETKFVRIHTDAICSIAFGDNPVATTDTMRLAAGQTEMFGVSPNMKVAVITNT